MSDIGATAVKTGMLLNAEIITAVAEALQHYGVSQLVVDPVMIATSGHSLIEKEALGELKARLLPLAALAFRRGWLLPVLLLAAMLPPNPGWALGWDALWQRADQRAGEPVGPHPMTAARSSRTASASLPAHARPVHPPGSAAGSAPGSPRQQPPAAPCPCPCPWKPCRRRQPCQRRRGSRLGLVGKGQQGQRAPATIGALAGQQRHAGALGLRALQGSGLAGAPDSMCRRQDTLAAHLM
jgi:hypothetical protein